jgi:hypothetical protein
MSRKLCAVVAQLVAACFLLAGCSGSGRPTVAPVHGKVTYHGEPVSEATVVFLCPGAPRLAVGKTDSNGNYQLTTYESNDGAVIGTHTVAVKKHKTEPGQTDAAIENVDPTDQAKVAKSIESAMRKSAQQIAKSEKSGSALPKKYSQLSTSDLHKEVVAGNNVIDIELEK